MVKLNGRQLNILKTLLSHPNVRIEDIGNKFDVSRRTVYREIAVVNEFLKDYNLRIANSHEGLIVEGNVADIEKLKLDMIGYRSNIEPKERRKLILSELLQITEPVKLEYFSRKFNVTTSTISYDLKELEEWLKKQGLVLVAKPGYGVYVSGNENSFRKAIAKFLYENFDTSDLINFLRTGYLKKNRFDKNIELRLLNLIDYDTVLKIEKAILRLESEIDFDIVESSYLGLIVHLALAVKRLKNGESIEMGEENLRELKKTEEYRFAQKLAGYLEEELDLTIPEDEIGYVTVHLIGAKYRANAQSYNYKDIENIAEEMIKKGEEIFNINFSNDKLLEEGLKTHLAPTIYRLKMGLDIRNPLLCDIKSKYPLLFEKSDKICDVLREKLNVEIPEDEVGYVAMHFGAALERMKDVAKTYNIMVVCASGIGTSRMLMSKLKIFPQINVVEVASSVKLKDIKDRKDIDLVVSTIPLDIEDKKVVVVNPLLLKEDVEKLKEALNTDFIIEYETKANALKNKNYQEKALHIANYGKRILELCDALVYASVEGRNSDRIIDNILEVLLVKKLIRRNQTAGIKKRLLNRESLGKIVLPGKGFVIYHCAIENLDFPLVVVGRVIDEFKMENLAGDYEKIKTAFLMLAPQEDPESIEVLGDLSASLIEDSNFVEDLNNAASEETTRQKVKEVLMKKYYEEIRRAIL
ncbi:BglG family transcription antiterminator [Thermosediminibacter oceani]|uniref:Transcriptional antiterminator, BglG family n=1 Tax=Thermosediminibacter oceani (strain ATCC BAA-1034 / DSM 16646 / JW/IW-1228P) TaxID=555079 RepID=D9RZT0_THEOJ|nr:BglG family transcription antiterminator [Thermosediminibacter oceani]ADL08707.1 transcriptional antiterminator, BglG family [Thermosediminibacter oceani DSM 16646]